MNVLYDTGALSHEMTGAAEYRAALIALERRVLTPGVATFISTVTLQELGVWGRMRGDWAAMRKQTVDRFTLLDLTLEVAERASELFAATSTPLRALKGASRDRTVDVWHRDAAVVATAVVHAMDLVITADKGMRNRFQNHYRGTFHVLEASHVGK